VSGDWGSDRTFSACHIHTRRSERLSRQLAIRVRRYGRLDDFIPRLVTPLISPWKFAAATMPPVDQSRLPGFPRTAGRVGVYTPGGAVEHHRTSMMFIKSHGKLSLADLEEITTTKSTALKGLRSAHYTDVELIVPGGFPH
jgi:hypothetical protein